MEYRVNFKSEIKEIIDVKYTQSDFYIDSYYLAIISKVIKMSQDSYNKITFTRKTFTYVLFV